MSVGRPLLHTSYAADMAMFNTLTKKVAFGALVLVGLITPLLVPDRLLHLLALGCAAAIGAIGLNLVTGYAGQVSLGHAFFLAVGAYTAAALAGDPASRLIGFGVENILVWLPAAGLVAALAGVLVAPLAVRLRGLYLAIVTLGLVVVAEYVLTEWRSLTGGRDIGRRAATADLFGYRFDEPGALLTQDQKLYLLTFVLLVVFGLAGRNIARSRVGRAFSAIRDRDIAAGVIGVNLARYKTTAFALSSFYAGCAGALIYTVAGHFGPEQFTLLLSVQYIAMVLIGGAGTISGSIMGALLLMTVLPELTRWLPALLPFIGAFPTDRPNVFQVETILYGALVILFLIFEPRGLFGIWVRIRNYWKAWPFSY
ncbi:MAG TPA: branched-chain amino acid ABC transporter permease [Micromonosporaceae bacterium]|nr:branched-chain amino acid ABC transporter permease [Micromonosporaceae bacterium]